MKKVLAFGTFDIFHPGHKYFLEQASLLGDELYIRIARDLNVKKYKGKRSKWDESKRLKEVLKYFPDAKVSLGYLDKSKIYECLSEIQPDIIALGYDQKIFVEKLGEELKKRELNKTKIVRLKSFKPEKYKSSFLK